MKWCLPNQISILAVGIPIAFIGFERIRKGIRAACRSYAEGEGKGIFGAIFFVRVASGESLGCVPDDARAHPFSAARSGIKRWVRRESRRCPLPRGGTVLRWSRRTTPSKTERSSGQRRFR
jgi:hypothetical protein